MFLNVKHQQRGYPKNPLRTRREKRALRRFDRHPIAFHHVSGVSRAKIEEVTLDALRTRQSLVKGERLVRHEMRAVLLGNVGRGRVSFSPAARVGRLGPI